MEIVVVDGKVLVTESPTGRLFVYFEEYNGKNFLHLRYWYKCKKDGGMWKPGMKGIAIPESNVRSVLEALKLVLNPAPSAPVVGQCGECGREVREDSPDDCECGRRVKNKAVREPDDIYA